MIDNITQDRTDIWMRPTPQQPDSLTAGSKRLARSFVSPPDGKNCISVKDWVIDLIKSDYGIRSLILFAEAKAASGDKVATVMLRRWETGK